MSEACAHARARSRDETFPSAVERSFLPRRRSFLPWRRSFPPRKRSFRRRKEASRRGKEGSIEVHVRAHEPDHPHSTAPPAACTTSTRVTHAPGALETFLYLEGSRAGERPESFAAQLQTNDGGGHGDNKGEHGLAARHPGGRVHRPPAGRAPVPGLRE